MRALIVTAALLSVALAGCIGGDDELDVDDGGEARATETTGSIYGQVLDDHFEPVANADVLLLQDTVTMKSSTTGTQGRYTINDIEPGEYLLVVEALCCQEAVERITIVAGEEVERDLRIPRLVSSGGEIYVDTDGEWTGFISCSISYPTSDFPAPCGFADPNRDETRTFNAAPDLHTIAVAMVWDNSPTNTEDRLRNRLHMCMDDGPSEDCENWQSQAREQTPSPLEYRYDLERPTEDENWFQFRVYGGSHTIVPANIGFVSQQPFTVYWHLFYGQAAPDGYSALPDT